MIRRLPFLLVPVWLVYAGAVEAQVVRGTVVDGSNGAAVPLAGVFLLDRDRSVVVQTMSDSLGRYVLEAPGPGDYVLAGQRLGYLQTASALLALGEDTYELDLELDPDPFQFDLLDVTVRNEVLVDWFRFEETIDRWQVAVVAVLPSDVYLFTRAFDGSQPSVRWAPIR